MRKKLTDPELAVSTRPGHYFSQARSATVHEGNRSQGTRGPSRAPGSGKMGPCHCSRLNKEPVTGDARVTWSYWRLASPFPPCVREWRPVARSFYARLWEVSFRAISLVFPRNARLLNQNCRDGSNLNERYRLARCWHICY